MQDDTIGVLVGEASAVDTLATGAIPPHDVAALAHESRHDAVDRAAGVMQACATAAAVAALARAQGAEVLARARAYGGEELDLYLVRVRVRVRVSGSVSQSVSHYHTPTNGAHGPYTP